MSAPAPRRVVVGYDASEAAERALDWAAVRAGRDGHLIVVHAAKTQHSPIPRLRLPTFGVGERERLTRAEAVAEVPFLERLDLYEIADCDLKVLDAEPADALLRVADEHDADEIVVGCCRSHPLRWDAGSVCTDLVDRSERPVVVVP